MYIEPDIFIIVKYGHIAADLNTRSFPEIELQSQYRPILSSGSCQDTASYLSAKYQEWRWQDRALRQRKQTITRIVSELITRQR
ncbi:RNA polymerase sigma-54 factor, partial [Bacillus vallismortis]|nr:RNA polymerase sigma-54 factor [Bacillus vallismortis]